MESKKIAVEDEEYRLKVMRGEDVSEILENKAKEKGYNTDTSWRIDHKATNAKDDVCITNIDRVYSGDGSIYSSKAAYYYGDGRSYDQKAINAIKKARNSPKALISIYRAVPNNIKDTRVRNGDWVAIDREYAEEHGWRMFDDDYRIIENKVPAKYLFSDGNSIHEFGYDNGNKNEVYKNTENNVKLNEVTYDDSGNLIPLSKRFDESKSDIRYSYAGQKARTANRSKPDIDRKDVVFVDDVIDSFEIKVDSEGNKFVDVDPSLFDARSGESHAQTIARIIKDRFNNLIEVNGQKIKINKTTNDEWRHSKSANHLMKHDSQIYNDKLKTIPFADEIIIVAKNWIGEKISHSRKDDIIEFARGNVYYRVGKNGYVADIIVGTRMNGSAVLYDIKNIYAKKITDVPVTTSKNPQRSAGTFVKESVAQSDDDVKIKFSLQETARASETREQLLKENSNLRVANTVLKNELKLTKGKSISMANAQSLARIITHS